MRFGRKHEQVDVSAPGTDEAPGQPESGAVAGEGPRDVSEIDPEAGTHIDLGSLLLAPIEGAELRMQVDEGSGEILSVMMIGEDSALEVRAFAAPKQPGLWADTREEIAAEVARQGGTSEEREGPFGPELFVQQPVTTDDGQQGLQPSRVIGNEGPRWLLRSTLLGRAAVEPDSAGDWEGAIRGIAVRRGSEAMPPGAALPLVLPAEARRMD
jgi:hypothetical protein